MGYIDTSIVLLYLMTILLIGIRQGAKIHNLRQFAVADKNYSDMVIVTTSFATVIGGFTSSGVLTDIYKTGLICSTWLLSFLLRNLLIMYVIAPKLAEYEECYSVGDILAINYGKFGRIISGFMTVLTATGKVGIQIIITSSIMAYFLGMNDTNALLASFVAIVIYSTLGGMKAVSITDYFQFWIIFLALILMVITGVAKFAGPGGIAAIAKDNFNYSNGVVFKYLLPLSIANVIPFEPILAQRILMNKNPAQLKHVMKLNSFVSLFYFILIFIIGIIAIKFITPGTQDIFIGVMDLVLPTFLKGIAVAGFLSIIMSSADSLINMGAVSLVNDVLKIIPSYKLSDKSELLLSRIMSFFVALLGLLLVIYLPDITGIMLKVDALWFSGIIFPIFFAFLGFRLNKLSFIIYNLLTITFWGVWENYFMEKTGIATTVSGAVLGCLLFFIFYTINQVFSGKYNKEELLHRS